MKMMMTETQEEMVVVVVFTEMKKKKCKNSKSKKKKQKKKKWISSGVTYSMAWWMFGLSGLFGYASVIGEQTVKSNGKYSRMGQISPSVGGGCFIGFDIFLSG